MLTADLQKLMKSANRQTKQPLRYLASKGSVDQGFDRRWAEHPKPQATTAGQLTNKTGLGPRDLAGMLVLDAGCGCGRFSGVAESWGAQMVGVDLSPAGLDAAMQNAPEAGLVQASLLDLPFKDGTFDLAFSVGVLHHTPDPRAAFLEVARTVKVHGELAVWVYCQTWAPEVQEAMDLMHEITKACPPEALHAALERHAVALRKPGVWGPLEQVLRISNSMDDEECISDSFDWHAPQYRSWHTVPEVREWFKEAGFEVVWVGEFPVSMRGRRIR
jgi:ubiquinone/menaquinone biosynthesis C-methylase UbiE